MNEREVEKAQFVKSKLSEIEDIEEIGGGWRPNGADGF